MSEQRRNERLRRHIANAQQGVASARQGTLSLGEMQRVLATLRQLDRSTGHLDLGAFRRAVIMLRLHLPPADVEDVFEAMQPLYEPRSLTASRAPAQSRSSRRASSAARTMMKPRYEPGASRQPSAS